MRAIYTVVLVGFLAISVFGLLLMPYDGSSHDKNCLASLINNTESPCPRDDPFGFASFHNLAVKKISSMTLVGDFTALYILAVMMFLSVGYILTSLDNKLSVEGVRFSRSEILKTKYTIQDTISFWFSLHENSPSLA